MQPNTSIRPVSRRSSALLTWSLRGGGALLVAGHVLLLARRIADATIAEPGVLWRWIASAATLAVAGTLWRRGFQPLRGRTGLAFLLVVLLLHAGGAAPAAANDTSARLALPGGLLLVALSTIAIALGNLFHGRTALPTSDRLHRLFATVAPQPFHGHPASPFASRPPPQLA